MKTSLLVAAKVSWQALVSSVLVLWFTLASSLHAHEVLPSIADARTVDQELVFEVRANLESFIALIDLSQTTDTTQSAQDEAYDALRSLPPDELAAAFVEFWPQMAEGITVIAGGTRLTPELGEVRVDPIGNVELVRSSLFTFTATLPEGATTAQVGWDGAFGVLVLRQMDVPAPYDGYLAGGVLSDAFALAGGAQTTGMQAFVDYIPVGFDHIVPKGLDHILFVLALFFLAARVRPLIIQISLFTVAHTITLALAALGYISVPAEIVEPLIAASIVFVAVENMWARHISFWRPFVIFGFGLLHGLGFASVLAEFGLPEGGFVAALIGFNVGVEIGQLFVVAVMFLCVWQAIRIDRGASEVGRAIAVYMFLLVSAIALSILNPATLSGILQNPVWIFGAPLAALFALCIAAIQLRDQQDAYRRIVAVPASLAIAFVGAYWFMERVFL